MKIYPRVKAVKPLEGYRLHLTFEDDAEGEFDCREILNFGFFSELADQKYFSSVFVDTGTASWPNGQDISPDTLYMKAIEGATWPLV